MVATAIMKFASDHCSLWQYTFWFLHIFALSQCVKFNLLTINTFSDMLRTHLLFQRLRREELPVLH